METENVTFEATFENGEPITDYTAAAYAEGFCEGDGASLTDQIKAWSYICGKEMYMYLQGFYGRTVRDMVEGGIMNIKGEVDWEYVEAAYID